MSDIKITVIDREVITASSESRIKVACARSLFRFSIFGFIIKGICESYNQSCYIVNNFMFKKVKKERYFLSPFFIILFFTITPFLFSQETSSVNLNEVIVENNDKSIFLKSYFRSWIIENDSLTDYVDGEALYLYPKAEFKKNKGIKGYLLSYRNFFNNEKNNKNTYKKNISISFKNDYYGDWNIPKQNIYNKRDDLKKISISENAYHLYNKNDFLIGYYINGEQGDSIEIKSNYMIKKNINVDFLRKEKWNKNDTPAYVLLKQNESILNNKKEIITEIFITRVNKNDYINKKTYKFLNINKSRYQNNFWEAYLTLYPLPKNILEKLKKLKEREN